MDKIKTVKIKNFDGSISEETYTFSIDAKDVNMVNGQDLQRVIGNIDAYKDGDIDTQLKKIDNDMKKISAGGDECEFIFPGRWGINGSGNSAIAKIKDKVLLFDANSATVWTYLNQMLIEENVQHIDYMIVSHFDGDHKGNLQNLIDNGYIDSSTKYIHPDVAIEFYNQSVIN